MARFNRLDANGDSKITAEEYVAPFLKQLSIKDSDHDGVLSRKELDIPHFNSMDKDQSGQLTVDEIQQFYIQQFKKLD
ncbi:MAG: EF-hand domain-containing protein, partial [Opitutales bacterium]|nr:EF-hand domain-containing protein [Opitutales bacterium]